MLLSLDYSARRIRKRRMKHYGALIVGMLSFHNLISSGVEHTDTFLSFFLSGIRARSFFSRPFMTHQRNIKQIKVLIL